MLFEVFDAENKELIFSRSYSCLYNEYSTTERAETETGSFEECILMPYPKKKVEFTFTSYDRKKVGTLIGSGSFDPEVDKPIPFTKEYKTINLHLSKTQHALIYYLYQTVIPKEKEITPR